MGIPAVPAKLDFRMCVQTTDGFYLTGKWYRITWGRGKPLPLDQLGGDGIIEEQLDARYSFGLLEIGDNDPSVPDDKGFVPHLYIDLRLVKEPGKPKKHARKKIDLDKDPPPDPKANPKPGSAPKEDAPSEEPEPAPQQVDPTLISMPGDKPPHDFDPEGRRRRAPEKKPEKPKEDPVETERRLEHLDRISADYHHKQTMVFELVWRLHNLGYLGFWSGNLTFPIDGGKHAEILDALNRYAFKHRLPLLTEEDMSSPDDKLDDILDHVISTHDDGHYLPLPSPKP